MLCHFLTLQFISTPEWIRTIDRRIRNPLLYPAELRARVSDSSVFLAFMGAIARGWLLSIVALFEFRSIHHFRLQIAAGLPNKIFDSSALKVEK
jgi:hypothetical protein